MQGLILCPKNFHPVSNSRIKGIIEFGFSPLRFRPGDHVERTGLRNGDFVRPDADDLAVLLMQRQLRVVSDSILHGAEVQRVGDGGQKRTWDVFQRVEETGVSDPSDPVEEVASDEELRGEE